MLTPCGGHDRRTRTENGRQRGATNLRGGRFSSRRFGKTRPAARRAALLCLLLFASPGAFAQEYPPSNDDQGFSPSVETMLQRLRARMAHGALKMRFSPRWEGPALPGAPSGGRVGITPVAGEGAGPLSRGWTAWSVTAGSFLEDKRAASAGKGHSVSLTAGLDRELSGLVTAGASVNYVHTRLRTSYNDGFSHLSALTLSPYLNLNLADWLTAEFTAGYVRNGERLKRTPFPGLPVTGRRHSDGYMLAASLNASKWFGAWLLSAHGGVVATRDRWKAFTESDGTYNPARTSVLTQGVVEGTISWWREPLLPYFTVAYTRDLRNNDPRDTDRDDFTFTGGAAWYGSGALEGLTLDLSASIVAGRRKQRNATVSFGLRWAF